MRLAEVEIIYNKPQELEKYFITYEITSNGIIGILDTAVFDYIVRKLLLGKDTFFRILNLNVIVKNTAYDEYFKRFKFLYYFYNPEFLEAYLECDDILDLLNKDYTVEIYAEKLLKEGINDADIKFNFDKLYEKIKDNPDKYEKFVINIYANIVKKYPKKFIMLYKIYGDKILKRISGNE